MHAFHNSNNVFQQLYLQQHFLLNDFFQKKIVSFNWSVWQCKINIYMFPLSDMAIMVTDY